MLYVNSLVFLICAAVAHVTGRFGVLIGMVAAYGYVADNKLAQIVALLATIALVTKGVINATLTIMAVIHHAHTITDAEKDMTRARRQGDGPAYEYARKDKAFAVNSLIGLMTELATWPIVGLDPRIAVRSLREQVKDGCRIPVRW